MSRTQIAASLRAVLFAGASLFIAATVSPNASAVLPGDQAEPVIECSEDETVCGEDLCCASGQECCAPSGDVPYCAPSC